MRHHTARGDHTPTAHTRRRALGPRRGAQRADEANTTASAAVRVAQLRGGFLRAWHAAIARWQARMADVGASDLTDAAREQELAQALTDLESEMHDIIDRSWKAAHRIGHAVRAGQAPTHISDDALAEIERQKRFASGFARDIAAGVPAMPGRMGIGNRSALYGNALTAAFNRGAVDAGGDDDLIYWRLGPCDHCADCPILAAHGPYTKATLPTMPRAGATECRANCCCYLEFAPGGAALDAEVPFVDTVLNPPPPPEGTRRPTDDERLQLRDLEARVNYARRKIAETAGTPEQAKWIAVRKEASRRRRELADTLGVHQPPALSVGEVVRGRNVSRADVRDLTKVRGIDGRTVVRSDVDAARKRLADTRDELQDLLDKAPPEGHAAVPDIDDLLIRAGAPPELFGRPAREAVAGIAADAPTTITLNAIGFGARASVVQHLSALVTLTHEVYDVEVGPFDDDWLELVLAGGTWIVGEPAEVRRFVAAWFAAVDTTATPALAPWTG